MIPMERKQMQNIVDNFRLGQVREETELKDGLVNTSYKVETDRGVFVVQGLSPIFDERVIQDYEEVQRYLRTNGLFVPVLLSSTEGHPCHSNGKVWRAFEYVPNTGPGKINPDKAYEMAKTLRKFHELMRKKEFKPRFKLDGFHDTPRIIAKLDACIENPEYAEKARKVEREYDFIRKNIETHYLPEDLEKTVIHGDPKQQNFLFDGDRVIAILDLDTMMHGSELIDLGDGFRAWGEQRDGGFDREVFHAAVEGYNSPKPLYDEAMIMKSVGLINLELAARFLTDFFEESYFNWDSKKYSSSAEHNLARTRFQLKYYQNFSKEFAKRRHFE
jgi:Ser/Thr protein kinase RdoA (MazF antagonist)